MKKLLLLILVTVLIYSEALAQVGTIKIRFNDRSPITVAIDKRLYEKRTEMITIGNIPAGRHRIKVFSGVVYGRPRNRQLVYDGYIHIREGKGYTMVVNRYRGTMTLDAWNLQSGRYRDREDDYDNHYVKEEEPVEESNGDERKTDRRDNRYDENSMSNNDIRELQTRVNDRITDTDKMKLMQTVLSDRTYYTSQVIEMLGWLSFESSKLDLAKWAYKGVLDSRNYWKIESVFSFSSTKDEFNDFIASMK